MPMPTPFHPRTSQLCTSMFYKDWAGYYTVCSYETNHDAEYYAFRNACGLFDATPLYKYEVRGRDAAAFLSRVTVKDITQLKPGQVTYLCWCDGQGKVVDDGTVTCVAPEWYRLTAAEPSLSWFSRFTRGYQVQLEDITARLGALALQGPTSRALLTELCGPAIEKLKFFRMTRTQIADRPVFVTRTGYTGDLGYEIWVENEDALAVYDAIFATGRHYGLMPAGIHALDVARIEAGFIMNGVDYHSAHHCLVPARMSSPYELGIGWTVQLERAPFNGQDALRKEAAAGSQWQTRGLVTDWPAYEALWAQYQLPPQVCTLPWRTSIPVYNSAGTQVGYATSGTLSPTLKKMLAIATLKQEYAQVGGVLQMEATVEHVRHKVPVTVTELPFYNPERKRSS